MMKARSLEEVFNLHRNSLTFLRLALAIVVIFSHSYQRLVFSSLSALILSLGFGIYSFIAPFILAYLSIGASIFLPFYKFGQSGDYSYGLYIYTYPIQQTIYFFKPDVSNVFAFFALSLIFTLPFSWLSWKLIEQPCLKFKTFKFRGAS
jgi:peptidoglycan/LPS O-acetylase OafA/YrhL